MKSLAGVRPPNAAIHCVVVGIVRSSSASRYGRNRRRARLAALGEGRFRIASFRRNMGTSSGCYIRVSNGGDTSGTTDARPVVDHETGLASHFFIRALG